VVAEGTTVFDQAVTRDCLTPAPSVGAIDECAEGGVSVTLINNGDDTADFSVNGTPVAVGPQTTVSHVLPAAEDQTLTVTITSGGQTLFDQSIVRNCSEVPPPGENPPPPTTTPPPNSPPANPPAPPRPSAAPVTPQPAATPSNTPAAPAAPTAAPAAPAQLAFTGPVTPGLLPLGLALFTVGLVVTALTRRPRRA
jgi:hypothetical protein